MTRYLVSTLVDCGVEIVVDAPDEDTARAAARWATRDHVKEACDSIEIDNFQRQGDQGFDPKWANRVIVNPDGTFAWGD